MRSEDRFESCFLALVAVLWSELDDWRGLDDDAVPDRVEALYLELALLHELADSFSLRKFASRDQRTRLRHLADDLWRLLEIRPVNCPDGDIGVAVQRAQDRLFEEARSIALDSILRNSTSKNSLRGSTSFSHCGPATVPESPSSTLSTLTRQRLPAALQRATN